MIITGNVYIRDMKCQSINIKTTEFANHMDSNIFLYTDDGMVKIFVQKCNPQGGG